MIAVSKPCLFFSKTVFGHLKADLHGAILAHATRLRQAYDMTRDCCSVLKLVLKCHDNLKRVVNLA